ncbi:MAG: hypothetical protein ABSG53_04885 [Thermoguttaceae bacterium]|jgi:hypothetical protein
MTGYGLSLFDDFVARGRWGKNKFIDPSFVNAPERADPNLPRRTKADKMSQSDAKMSQSDAKMGQSGAKMGQK